MKKLIFILVIGMLFASCDKKKAAQEKKEPSLKEYMTSSWQTTYLKIDMPTFQKSENSSVMEDKFGPDAPRFARSTYNSDGTFSAWFVDKDGKDLGGTSTGNWDVKGDTLYVDFVYGGRDVKVGYHIEKTEAGFRGVSKYDWDEDGEYDDTLLMETKRIQLQD